MGTPVILQDLEDKDKKSVCVRAFKLEIFSSVFSQRLVEFTGVVPGDMEMTVRCDFRSASVRLRWSRLQHRVICKAQWLNTHGSP